MLRIFSSIHDGTRPLEESGHWWGPSCGPNRHRHSQEGQASLRVQLCKLHTFLGTESPWDSQNFWRQALKTCLGAKKDPNPMKCSEDKSHCLMTNAISSATLLLVAVSPAPTTPTEPSWLVLFLGSWEVRKGWQANGDTHTKQMLRSGRAEVEFV